MSALLFLAAVLAKGPSSAADDADIAALMQSGVHEITLPLRACFRTTADRYEVPADEMGDARAANAFVGRQFEACGLNSAMARVRDALRRQDGRADAGVIDRRAGIEMNALQIEGRQIAERRFRLPPPPPPVIAPTAAQPNMAPIDIPYQAIPAFQIYTSCFSARFDADPRTDSGDPAELRQANVDAVAACRQVREEQLRRALRLVTDYRLYGGSEVRAEAAVRRAFDRFDTDLLIEPPEQTVSADKVAAPEGD